MKKYNAEVVEICENGDAILQFLFDFNLTLGYTYGVRVDKDVIRD